MSVLIDSDILIEVSRGRDRGILAKWIELADSNEILLCSPVTVAELWHGARPPEYEILTNLFRVLTCVPIDHELGRQAGDLLRKYRKSHHLELGDALIAATVSTHGASLWTRNRKHYPMKDLTFY